MKQSLFKTILLFLLIACFIIIYYSKQSENDRADKANQKTKPNRKIEQKSLDYPVIGHENQVEGSEIIDIGKDAFGRFIKRLRSFLKEATIAERKQIEEILDHLKSHNLTDDEIALLDYYISYIHEEDMPMLFSIIFSYLSEAGDPYVENMVSRLFENWSQGVFFSKDVKQAYLNLGAELTTKGIAIYNKTKNDVLKRIITNVLSYICDRPDVSNFFSIY